MHRVEEITAVLRKIFENQNQSSEFEKKSLILLYEIQKLKQEKQNLVQRTRDHSPQPCKSREYLTNQQKQAKLEKVNGGEEIIPKEIHVFLLFLSYFK